MTLDESFTHHRPELFFYFFLLIHHRIQLNFHLFHLHLNLSQPKRDFILSFPIVIIFLLELFLSFVELSNEAIIGCLILLNLIIEPKLRMRYDLAQISDLAI